MSGARPLRSLERFFLESADPEEEFELPEADWKRLTKVLRLSPGAEILVLPGDGTAIRCILQHRAAVPQEVVKLRTEPALRVVLAQSLPKADKAEEIVRACTSLGVGEFVFFSSDRTVVKWDKDKEVDKTRRLQTIAQEAAEVSFRAKVPKVRFVGGLGKVFAEFPEARVLSEREDVSRPLEVGDEKEVCLVVGPEGGWSPSEVDMIGPGRAVTLGPRVLRVEHAGAAAVAKIIH